MNMPQSINLTYICFNGDHTDEEPTVLNLQLSAFIYYHFCKRSYLLITCNLKVTDWPYTYMYKLFERTMYIHKCTISKYKSIIKRNIQ